MHNAIDQLKQIEEIVGISAEIDASLIEEYILDNFFEGVTYNR